MGATYQPPPEGKHQTELVDNLLHRPHQLSNRSGHGLDSRLTVPGKRLGPNPRPSSQATTGGTTTEPGDYMGPKHPGHRARQLLGAQEPQATKPGEAYGPPDQTRPCPGGCIGPPATLPARPVHGARRQPSCQVTAWRPNPALAPGNRMGARPPGAHQARRPQKAPRPDPPCQPPARGPRAGTGGGREREPFAGPRGGRRGSRHRTGPRGGSPATPATPAPGRDGPDRRVVPAAVGSRRSPP
jgi:hypothetical protein